MVAVDEIHVGVPRRAEEHRIAWSETCIRVRGGIVLAEVRFVLDDPAGEQLPAFATDEQFAQQLASHDNRVAVEELARENWRIAQHRSRKLAGGRRRLLRNGLFVELSATVRHASKPLRS